MLDFDVCCKTSFTNILENTDVIDDIISSANYPDVAGTRKNIDRFIRLICEKEILICLKVLMLFILTAVIRCVYIKTVDILEKMPVLYQFQMVQYKTIKKEEL